MTNEERIIRDHELDAYGDTMFAPLAAEHPEACSCEADYPGWTPDQGCISTQKLDLG